jgi:hypothetical protein
MAKAPSHIGLLKYTGKKLATSDGKKVEVWELNHVNDEKILSSWAKHFRNHYCLDKDIDCLRGNLSRKDYLNNLKFPSPTTKLGPATRAGDFGEILVADYLQWVLNFWVPRVRWESKMIRDESPKGCDVIGFQFHKQDGISKRDVLAIFETKTKFSKTNKNRMQDAINDSAKDHIRIDESLNYIKQRLFERKRKKQAGWVERFQSPVDTPYQESYGAAAIITEKYFHDNEITLADAGKIPKSKKSKIYIPHPNKDQLALIVIKGADMMPLVHELYKRSADEA